MASRLQEKYMKEVAPALMEKFGYKNVMEIPKLDKIVINMGIGDARENPKGLEKAVEEMEIISGQKPVVTRARKSVANFKLREGMPIGAKVTLRADKMFYFMDKLVSVSLPRVRDFRGVNANAFDGRGNYALGVKVNKEAPIHISNVMPLDPETGKGTRVRFEVKDGKKVRVSVKSGKEI